MSHDRDARRARARARARRAARDGRDPHSEIGWQIRARRSDGDASEYKNHRADRVMFFYVVVSHSFGSHVRYICMYSSTNSQGAGGGTEAVGVRIHNP